MTIKEYFRLVEIRRMAELVQHSTQPNTQERELAIDLSEKLEEWCDEERGEN
jgi:hypothetical protein